MNSHCGFRRLAAACLFLLIFVVMGQAKAPTTQPADKEQNDFTAMPGRQLVQALLDEKTRQKAHLELRRRTGRTHKYGFQVPMEVVSCPQPAGKDPLYVVLYQDHMYHDHMPWGFRADRPEELFGERIFKPYVKNSPDFFRSRKVRVATYTQEGEETLFDLQHWVRVAGRVAVMDINGDGFMELITSVQMRLDRRFGESFRSPVVDKSEGVDETADLHGYADILMIFPVSQPFHATLVIIYNWKGARGWDYAMSDIDNDGVQEIVLGPKTPEGLSPEVTFVWDKEKNAYVGPKPSPRDHFRQINPSRIQQEVNRFLANPPKPVATKLTSRPASRPVSGSAQSKNTRTTPTVRQRRDRNGYRIPEDFWTLPPKQAALTMAEMNRSEAHRKKYRLALDDRDVSGPPESCAITLYMEMTHWANNKYRYTLHVDQKRSNVTYQSGKVWGRSSTREGVWGAETQYELSYEDAKHAAATIWWLYRLRTWRTYSDPEDSAGIGARSWSSADGRGSLSLVAADGDDIEVSGKRCWLNSIPRPGQTIKEGSVGMTFSERWVGHYDKETFLNLAVPVITQILFDRHRQDTTERDN